MRRILVSASFVVTGLAVACAAEAPPPAPPPPPPPVAVLPPPPPPHAPAPPLPPGVDASSLDPTVSPCTDFFQYACGGWNKANPIPEDEGRWGRFNALAEQNQLALKDILEKDAKIDASAGRSTHPKHAAAGAPPSAAPEDGPYAVALGSFYSSCMDEAGVEKDGLSAIRPLLQEIDGVSSAASLATTLAHLQLVGAQPFFVTFSEQDAKDATTMIAGIDQSGLGMPDRDYYKDDEKTAKVRDAYLAHVERVFVLLGDKPAVAHDEAASVLAEEKLLAAAQISRVDHRDPDKIYHKVDRAGLAATAPTFAWDVYWNALGIPKVATVNVYEPQYLTAAFTETQASPTADKKTTWAATMRPYLRWHACAAFLRVLPQRFVDESFSFEKELSGAAKIQPRWKRCVKAVDGALGEALGAPFALGKLGADGKAATEEMVRQIEAAMESDLGTLAWMDGDTRSQAMIKVHKLFNKIGYPDHWRDYSALVPRLKKTSYASNVAEANRFELRRKLAQVGKPVDRTEWGMSPPTVNAYYNAQLNEMVFPAGILQPPFFTKGAPAAVNFGGLGMVMGHELTHGFDDEGRKFDADGNLKVWWTPTASASFDKRASCVSDQFDGYVAVDDLTVNGKLTLGENLADLGGIKLAMASLRAAAKGQAAADEAARQFFFGLSQVWCGSTRPEMQRVRVRTDPHSPPRWRVNGPLSNTPDFAAAFSCRAGDAMVRPDALQCSVW